MALTAPEAIARFWQMPKMDPLPYTREWVYFLESQIDPPLIKIGKTRDLRWRLITLQYMSPVALRLVGAITGPAGTERVLHVKFAPLRQHGEWFVKNEQLAQFISGLPKGEKLPPGVAEGWASELGVGLLAQRRRVSDPDHFENFDREQSRYWGKELVRSL